MPIALVTGGTRGLGRALVEHLTHDGWTVVFDARRGADTARTLAAVTDGRAGKAIAVTGDVTHPGHRADLVEALGEHDLDLVVNNAGSLGPAPLPRLIDLDAPALAALFDANAVAPLALFQAVAHRLTDHAVVINVTSDAAVEPYTGWGGYGASKAALEQISSVLAVEHPELSIYSFDPGDMRTDMHQAAFPGQDISDRPTPESVVPHLIRLVDLRPPSGRYTAAQFSNRPVLL